MQKRPHTDEAFYLRIDTGTGAERLAMLRKALSITGTVELDDHAAAIFTGEAHGKIFGELMVHAVSADPIRMTRDRSWVRSVTRDLIFLNHVIEGHMEGQYRGRPYRVGTGCLTVSRLTTEMDVTLPRRRTALAVPKALLDKRMAWQESLDGRVFPAGSPTAILLGRHIEGLLALTDVSRPAHKRVLNATVNLMADLFGAKPMAQNRAKQKKDNLSPEVRRFILRHLGNSELNAAMICREFGISPSQLARLLGKGFNLAESIRGMRLHNAYQDILDGVQPRSIKAIGVKWGIPDEGTFRRNFRSEFGLSPSAASKLGAPDAERTAQIARSMAELEHWFKEG